MKKLMKLAIVMLVIILSQMMLLSFADESHYPRIFASSNVTNTENSQDISPLE